MDTIVGTAGNDGFTADNTTLSASDTISGGAGIDTLTFTDGGTVGGAVPAALVSGVEVINVRNVNTAGATAEVASVATAGLAANSSLTIAGRTITTAGTAMTATELQTALATGATAVAGVTVAGVLAGYTAAAGAGTTVVFTSTSLGNVADLTAYGTTAGVAVTVAQGANGVTDTIAAGNFVGATDFNSNLSTNGLTITGLAAGQKIGVTGNGSIANGALTATYKAGVTAATLNVVGGTTAGAVTISGDADALLKTLTINSTGAANTLTSIAAPAAVTAVNINAATNLVTGGISGVAAATTITVAGAAANTATLAAVDLGALSANVTVVNASGLTAGGIKATIGAVAQVITGGAGNDTITTNGVQTGAIDAGAGTGDKLIVANVADVAVTPAAKFTNFEILQNNVAATVDASLVAGITSVVLNNAGAGGFTNLSATQAAAVSVLASTAGSTLALKDASGTADVLTITGTTTTAGTAVNVTNLVVTGVETLNFTNSATAASTLSLAGTGSTGLKTITVAGAKGVTLDVAAAATPAHATTLTSISASGLTAQATGTNTFTLQDTVGGHALKAGLTVTGSAGDDVFSFGTDTIATGLVQVNGDAGNDGLSASLAQLFTTGQGAIAFDGGANGTAGDTLTITDAAAGTINDSTFANVKNVENLAFSNTGALSLTSGGFFNTAFANGVTITDGTTTTNAVTVDLTLFSAAAKVTNVGTTGAQAITGGASADTITITSALASTAGTNVTIKGGAGADTIKVSDASVTTVSHAFDITGGAGADKIDVKSISDTTTAVSKVFFNVAIGDSTVGAADTITGFNVVAAGARLADTIDFAGNAIKPLAGVATTAVTGSTLAELALTVSTSGLLSFTGTKAVALTAAQVETIWTSQVSALLNNLETVVWASANTADTQYGNSLVFNHNTLGDSEVILVGVQATTTGAAAATANLVGIA